MSDKKSQAKGTRPDKVKHKEVLEDTVKLFTKLQKDAGVGPDEQLAALRAIQNKLASVGLTMTDLSMMFDPSIPDGAAADAMKDMFAQMAMTAADLVANLARKNATFFHTADDSLYVDVTVNGRRQTWPFESRRFERWLKQLYYTEAKKGAPRAAVKAAIEELEGDAQFKGEQREVYLRVAPHAGAIYIDLGADAVGVTAAEWKIVKDPPVRFVRPRSFLPLPTPQRGGSMRLLRP
jgi:hypothetical protein